MPGKAIETPIHPIGELLEVRNQALRDRSDAERAINQLLSGYEQNGTLVRVVGYPSLEVVPQYDVDGELVGHATTCCPSFDSVDNRVQPKEIHAGTISAVIRDFFEQGVEVRPLGSDTSWAFALGAIVELEEVPIDTQPEE